MTETGKVLEIKGNFAIIAPEKSAACFGCMNHECRAGKGFITAENQKSLPLEKGQTVEVYAPGASIAGQALVSFLPPILAFIAGFGVTRLLFPGVGEGAAAGMGVILLFFTAYIVYLARKRIPADMVYIVTKII